LTEYEARELIVAMVAPGSAPELTDAEVDALLVWSRRADVDDRAPSDEGWAGAWDVTAAAAEGWLRKAGKVAASFDFGTVDGQQFQRSQMHAMCLEMSNYYRRGVAVSVLMATDHGYVTDILGNVNDG